jgi:RND family efflux transporter MFP subunit
MRWRKNTQTIIIPVAWRKLTIFLLVACWCVFATIAILSLSPANETITEVVRDGRAIGMPISVHQVQPKAYPAVVTALGEVLPLWQSTIKARVEGAITYLSPRLQVGNRVKAGELLARIAKEQFQMKVSEAKERLATATVNLLREEREAREARKNWERSGIGGKPASALVLRQPQLEAAQAEVKAARAALTHAETQLANTDIRAPFSGVIMQRAVNPGETLFTGDDIFKLYGMQTMEIGVHLDAEQWELLGKAIAGTTARLMAIEQGGNWTARVVRDSLQLDRESRLRTIFLQVDKPLEQTPPLLPGTFVRAEISGPKVPDLLCIPETALTQQGLVWYVDQGNRLLCRRAEPVFYGKGVIYIRYFQNSRRPLRVAVWPNAGYTRGLHVQPLIDKRS